MRILFPFLSILVFSIQLNQNILSNSFLKTYDFSVAANAEEEFEDEEGSEEEQENEEIEENA